MLPVLRKLVKELKAVDYEYMIIVNLIICSILPIAQFVLGRGKYYLNPSLSPVLFVTQNVFYALAGFYFENLFSYDDFKHKKIRFMLFSLAAVLISELMTVFEYSVNTKVGSESNVGFLGIFAPVLTFSVFCIMKWWLSSKTIDDKYKHIISTVGQCTFGIYLFEAIAREKTLFVYLKMSKYITVFPAGIVWVLICFSLCLCFTLLLKKIPFICKYI